MDPLCINGYNEGTEAIEIVRKEGLSIPVRAPCSSDSVNVNDFNVIFCEIQKEIFYNPSGKY